MNPKSILFAENSFPQISEWLKKGEVVLIPTETVYGFSADPEQKNAVEKVQKIKQRPADKAFLLLMGNLEEAKKYVEFSDFALFIATKFWPGPLTIVLPRKKNALADYFPEFDSLAIRIPDHAELLSFLNNYWQKPLLSTSANISGQAQNNEFSALEKVFSGQDILFCKGNIDKNNSSSTIIKIKGEKVIVLRSGMIPENKITNIASRF